MATNPQLSANDLVRMSDEELDKYLNSKRASSGDKSIMSGSGSVSVVPSPKIFGLTPDDWFRAIQVQDPENLTEPFLERLRQRAAIGEHSQAADPNEVAKRLQAVVDNAANHRRSHSLASTSTQSEESLGTIHKSIILDERWSYVELVKDGCPPWYPISKLEEVADNPTAHRHLISPWDREGDFVVFGKQLYYWEQFRLWQIARREANDLETCQRDSCDHLMALRIEHDLQLKKAPKDQEPWSQWLEFLDYVGCEREEAEYDLEKTNSRRNQIWKQFRDSGALKAGATEEDVMSFIAAKSTFLSGIACTTSEMEARHVYENVSNNPDLAELSNSLKNKYSRIRRLLRELEMQVALHSMMWTWAVDKLPKLKAKKQLSDSLQTENKQSQSNIRKRKFEKTVRGDSHASSDASPPTNPAPKRQTRSSEKPPKSTQAAKSTRSGAISNVGTDENKINTETRAKRKARLPRQAPLGLLRRSARIAVVQARLRHNGN